MHIALATMVVLVGIGQVEAGLVAFWEMENGSDSVDGHHGTIHGNPTLVDGVPHLGGKALAFDGNDYISVPHHTDLTPIDGMTVTAWFNPTAFLPGPAFSWPAIIKKVNDAENSGYTMEIPQAEVTPKASFIVSSSTGGVSTPDLDLRPVAIGTWYFLAGVYEYNAGLNQSTLTTFFGPDFQTLQLASTTFTGPIVHSSLDLNIGRDNYNTGLDRYFNGIIDDVRFYDEALGLPEIEDIYTIPEPSTITLAALALVGLLAHSHRRSSSLATNT